MSETVGFSVAFSDENFNTSRACITEIGFAFPNMIGGIRKESFKCACSELSEFSKKADFKPNDGLSERKCIEKAIKVFEEKGIKSVVGHVSLTSMRLLEGRAKVHGLEVPKVTVYDTMEACHHLQKGTESCYLQPFYKKFFGKEMSGYGRADGTAAAAFEIFRSTPKGWYNPISFVKE